MRTFVCIVITLFVCSPQIKAGDISLENAIDKDINESLSAILSVKSLDPERADREEKVNSEANRLIKKYGKELIEPMKNAATKKIAAFEDAEKRYLALRVLEQVGKSDPNAVRQTFLDLLKHTDDQLRRNSVYALATIDKKVAKDVAVSALNTAENPLVKESIIPLLGVIGDANSLLLLEKIEQDDNQKQDVREAAFQAREYIEHRMNLPTEADQKSWEEQAYVYWLLPNKWNVGYINEEAEYYKKAEILAERGYRFSLDFLRYHLQRKNLLAAAIIGVQKEKDAVEDLEKYVSEDGGRPTTFKRLCSMSLYVIRDKDKLENVDRRGRPIERTE